MPASIAMFGATALWGLSGGVVASIPVNGFEAAAAVELVAGIALIVAGMAQGHSSLGAMRALRRLLPVLAAIEATNVVLYYVALQVGPTGPVMAMHLTAPIILSTIAVLRGKRRLTMRWVLSIALMSTALVLFGIKGGLGSEPSGLLLGIGLSLGSAACLAVFIVSVRTVAIDVPPAMAAGLQMLCSGLLLSPALLLSSYRPAVMAQLAVIGLVLFAPACWLYWKAMRILEPIPAGTIQLAEPLFGVVAAAVLTDTSHTTMDIAAATLVLAAVYLELSSKRSGAEPAQLFRRRTHVSGY